MERRITDMNQNLVRTLTYVVTGVSLAASVVLGCLQEQTMKSTVAEEVAKQLAEAAAKESV